MSTGRWLTPNAPPEHKAYVRRVIIPADIRFLAPISGALVELTFPSAWEQDGDLTPDETAAIFSGIYQQFLPFDNEPPDWETPDDLDGQPEQPWYEDLADWIIAGFLAITFTPQAAIVYQATVPKLRVAFRTGNLGALFRVLINGVEVWTGDSYAPITDLIEQVFDMSAETEPYTVRIEHNGVGDNINGTEAKLEVIRGKALADMVATILRADPTGCGIQWSTDNGDTWDTVDLATCITGLANDAIINAVNSGYLQRAGGQLSPGGAPAPDECKTFHVTISGDGIWKLPFPVDNDYTIAFSNFKGGWTQDGLAWVCPDGTPYVLGGCVGNPVVADETFPLPDANVMQVIGRYGEQYFDPFDGTLTVTGLENPVDVVFQANDIDRSDNAGTVEFDIEVCRPMWTFTLDAANGLEDATILNNFGAWSVDHWVVANGGLYISVVLPQMTSGRYVDFYWHGETAFIESDLNRVWNTCPATDVVQNDNGPHLTLTTVWDGQGCISFTTGEHPAATVTSLVIRGTGVSPF